MKYEIQNNSGIGKAFKVHGGLEEVERGATRVVDAVPPLTEEQIETYRRSGVTITRLDPKAIAEREKAARDAEARAKAEAEEAARVEAERADAERKAAEEAEKAKAERDALVARAAELKVTHAAGIDDEALKALITEAEAKAKAETKTNPAQGK